MSEWPRVWAKYRAFKDAYRAKAWQEQNPETTFDWKVERDVTRIRGWLLLRAPKGWWDDPR